MDIFLLISLLLFILGVIGSLTPIVPGSLLSVSGVLLYWWSTAYTQPGTLALVILLLVGFSALLFDWLSGFISAKISGVSTRIAIAAGIIGFILLFVLGPFGIFIGTAGTVFLREYLRTGNPDQSLKSAFYTSLGILGSSFVQFSLNLLALIIFVLTVFL